VSFLAGSPRICIRHFTRHPVHGGLELIHLRDASINLLVPSSIASVLAECFPFRTAAEHAAAVGPKARVRPEDLPRLAEAINAFVGEGAFIDLDEIAHRGLPLAPPPAISTIAFVTKDRPGALERAVSSYARNAIDHGHAVRVLVCDDSKDRATRDANRDRLTRVSHSRKTRVLHVGAEEKRVFAAALATKSGVDRSLIEFALFDAFDCDQTYGANRNAMLLLTGGELVLSADDDTVCRPVAPPERITSMRFVASDPWEYWFHEDVQDVIQRAHYEDIDVLSEHERLLGVSLASLVGRDLIGAELSGICRHMADGLAARGRVAVTQAGIVGDSGMYSPMGLLLASSSTRARLVGSEHRYRSALRSRAIQKLARGFTVAHHANIQGGVFGVDNRWPLVPFLPIMRNEDGVFATTLQRCFEDAFVGYPPHALVHAPEDVRAFAPLHHLSAARELRLSDLITALVLTAPVTRIHDGHARVRALGRYLVDLASQSPEDFAGTARQALAEMTARFAIVLTNVLRDHGEQPAYWAEDVRAMLDSRVEAVASPASWLPSDLRETRAAEDVAALTLRIVARWGELLMAWEALASAAESVRSSA
jgi:hypothetical protein